jgi:U32 family peptidase
MKNCDYKKKIYILAPVGDFSCLAAAIKAKADAVYFGTEKLNMRTHGASNFKEEDLEKISATCKKNNIKSYLTLNTIIYDDDLGKMKEILKAAKKANIDAIIASDFSVINNAHEMGLKVHLSTQVNISNIEAVKFFSKYADVMVLARELPLEKIKAICETIANENIRGPSGNLIQIELFVHGALCVAISGKCYMSLAQYNMSANRGECLQACRRKYQVREEETGKELLLDNKYIMSPKDLCTISILDQIVSSGVTLLKIEGRARPAEYVDKTVQCYKDALKSIERGTYTKEKINKWIEKLKTVFNRDFWQGGYYLGNELGEWTASYGSRATQKKTYVGKATNYFSKIEVAEFLIQAHELKVGSNILIVGEKSGLINSTISNLRNEKGLEIQTAQKGEKIAFPLAHKVRKNDKLYLIENNTL